MSAGSTRDAFDLERFVRAQAPIYADALAELRAGRKQTHWMWFVFPQLRELGRSPTALFYGIGSLAEARAYLAHDLLGVRLAECVATVLALDGRSLGAIFGSPDDRKFHSSMTLFDAAANVRDNPFATALRQYCGGTPDPSTLALLDTRPS